MAQRFVRDMARIIAAALVFVHLAFIAFVVLGVLAVRRWPRLAWLHVPAVAWAAWIELSGGICPLTPLENHWRAAAGLSPYAGDFIARWVFPVLYPEGLTRGWQIAFGAAAAGVNILGYGWLLCRPPSATRSF
jgi:hypothetical protein